jgi:hypothetical protein
VLTLLTVALLTMPSAASADRSVHLQRGGQTITIAIQGHPRASDLTAIKTAVGRTGGASASAAVTNFCGRSVLSGQNCGNVPTDWPEWNTARYLGRGTVRVCAVSAIANHFYPNGDPRFAWIGACGNNEAGIGEAPLWSNRNYGGPTNPDGWWINNTVVNASPWTHTIHQHIDFLPFSSAGVCWFEVQC